MDDQALSLAHANHVPLVECTRGGLVESIHFGSFAVTRADGTLLLAAGNPDAPVYARSSLKPLQSVAMVRAGLDLPMDLLALSAASHSGAMMHQEGARHILKRYGVDETALRNIVDLPYGVSEREAWLRAGGVPTQLAHNCSGKHAAMVATCVINGWSTDDYLELNHPLQKLVAATIAELTGEAAAAVSVDGCGTPVFANSLHALARSYARLSSASPESPEGRVVSAMCQYPEMVAGEGRDVARLMRAAPGVVAKEGAEAVQLIGLPEGIGIAIKISDGGDRARLPMSVRILAALGVDSALLNGLNSPPILGGGKTVGELRTTEEVDQALRDVHE